MQAVILAAGQSSRFFPFASESHKSLVEVLGKPLIEHTIGAIAKSGISEIIIVQGKDSKVEEVVGSGNKWGVKIEYIIQNEPLGGGNGLLSAKSLIKDDFFLVYPHRVDFDLYKQDLLKKKKEGLDGVLLLKESNHLSKYGFVEIKEDRVVDLLEKPDKATSHSGLRVVGIYLLSKEFLNSLEKTPQEEYQLETAISSFSKNSKIGFVETKYEPPTLKYSYDLLGLKSFLLSKVEPSISEKAKLDKSVRIEGKVVIEDGATISENVSLKGPCYIGRNVYVGTGTLIRDNSSLEEGSKVGAFSEIKNSIFGKNSSLHSGYIGDSIVGENCKIGVYSCTSNVRLDREDISVELPEGDLIPTGLKNLGAIIGNKCTLGVRVTLMPGITIGENSVIGPFSIVTKSLPENSLYYSKFDRVVEKRKSLK